MILLNPLLVLLPLTLYIRISFGALYRRHSVFTRRWPSLDEINDALQHPGISAGYKGNIKRLKYLVYSYYTLLAVAAAGYALLFFI